MLDAEVLAWHLRALPSDAFVKDLFELRRSSNPPRPRWRRNAAATTKPSG